jgi:glucoamylase
MPLVWAHAEHLKLLRSLREQRVFDLPPQTVQRYLMNKLECPHMVWRFNHKIRALPAGRRLRIETRVPSIVHWSADGWGTTHDTPTRDTGLTIQSVDLPTTELSAGASITFTFYWPQDKRWEDADFVVEIAAAKLPA